MPVFARYVPYHLNAYFTKNLWYIIFLIQKSITWNHVFKILMLKYNYKTKVISIYCNCKEIDY